MATGIRNTINEGFQVQDPVKAVDALAGRNESRKSGIHFTRRNGMITLGVALIGVLAVTAVVAVTVTSSTSSGGVEPVSLNAKLPKEPAEHPAAYLARSQRLTEAKLEEAEAKVKNIVKSPPQKKVNPRHGKSDLPVCKTPQCLASATRLKQSIDPTVNPCDDFYEFACGRWYNNHPVTNESLGTFYKVDSNIQEELLLILESAPTPGEAYPLVEMRTHYAACMDTDRMNSIGLTPLWAQLNVQGGWPIAMDNWNEKMFVLEEALIHVQKIGVSPLVSVAPSPDIRNTSHKILYVNEGQLAFTSAYLLEPEKYAKEINFYKTYISDSAKLVRDSIGSHVTDDAIEKDTNDLVNFEIAVTQAMNFVPRNKTDVFAKTDVAGLQMITDTDVAGQIDWLSLFRAMFGETDVVINEDEPLYLMGGRYMIDLSTLLSNTPERTVANYLGWWWTKTTGPETTYAMRNVSFNFQQNVFGVKSPQSRTTHCVDQTNLHLGFPLSRAYVDAYFPSHAKEQTTELVQLIRQAFLSLLDENTWMSPDDLVVAKEKLEAVVDHEAYPDWIMDNALMTLAYEGLKIKPGEQYNNLMRIAEYSTFWNLETFRDAYTKTFIMPPTIVNAFYDPTKNDITILAGILQAPFYTYNSLAALNYGGIGMVIGHEFTHGFDNTGRRFDKDGNLVSWWSRDTIKAFNERTKCFKAQYNAYSPPELQGTEYSNMTVDGQQTLGENIADNGGIREAFKGYMSYVEKYGEEPRLPGLEQYTPNQLFFLGFANVWCEHKTTTDLVNQLEYDPHSPGRFRVNGALSNDRDFSDTFNCPVDTPMNRGDASCLLW